MTIEEKARAYDEALNKIKPLYEQAKREGNPIWSTYEYLIPELRESEDERMMRVIGLALTDVPEERFISLRTTLKDCLAYLEKQKEQKPYEPHNWPADKDNLTQEQKPVKLNGDTEVGLDRALQIVKAAKGNLCGYQSDDGIYECDHAIQTLERTLKNGIEQKLVMIQWTGKNLKEVIDFTGKSPRFDEWFKSWEEFEDYVHSHNDILKLFCEDGSHYEVPVGAWIVKTPDGYNTPSRFRFIQKPVEWSEEDEKIMQAMIKEGDLKPSEIAWLKSLRPSWKPSKAQMKALRNCVLGRTPDADARITLEILWNNLQKLM